MGILIVFIRILFFYVIFSFIFKLILGLLKMLTIKPNKYSKESSVNKAKDSRDKNNTKVIVDAEYEEIKE